MQIQKSIIDVDKAIYIVCVANVRRKDAITLCALRDHIVASYDKRVEGEEDFSIAPTHTVFCNKKRVAVQLVFKAIPNRRLRHLPRPLHQVKDLLMHIEVCVKHFVEVGHQGELRRKWQRSSLTKSVEACIGRK